MTRPPGSIAALLALLVLLAGCAASPASVQQQLLGRHLDARGGRPALEKLKVVERLGTIAFQRAGPDAKGPYRTCVRYPDRVVIDIDAGPVQIHQVLGNGGAFECDASFMQCKPASAGVRRELERTASGANREELEAGIADSSSLRLIANDGTYTGYRYVDGGLAVEYVFSPVTGLLRQVKRGDRERRYDAWRDVGGVQLPMWVEDFDKGERISTVLLFTATHGAEPSDWCAARLDTAVIR